MDLLKDLNKEQKEAVLHIDGPLLVLAGAGSGKTKVLTHRIAYLIQEKNVHPANILAITFTNKAAKEMRERIDRLVEDVGNSIWVSTFHSMCVRILRRDIEKIDYDKSFVIFDYTDQQNVVKDCLKELNLNEKNYPPKSILEMIGRAKDELITPDSYLKMYSGDFRMEKVARVYELYQKKLKQNNALDFDDIIMLTIKLFVDNPNVLDYYQRKFRYILVDEYQDTNTAQYSLVSLLAQGYRNLCVVGDDDQSIYGWRGANIRNILDFEKEFKDAKVIKLEQNYRSTQTILDAANHVIKNNLGRKNKSLWTDNKEGDGIKYLECLNEHEEAYFVASEIKRLCTEKNRSYKDFAILYRINAMSRVVEDVLMKEGISYKIFGGLKFYDRKEIKDVIAYLRVIQNPADNISLKRIINEPKRGIGNTTVDNAEKLANERGVSIFSIISSAAEIPELIRASAKLEKFVSLINSLRAQSMVMTASEMIGEVIERTGILKAYEEENTIEAQGRIENMKELLSVAMEFENENEEKSLTDFLAHVSLVSDIDTMDEDSEYVALMTLHSAKGLEFPVVFLVGMEEGIFPGYRSMTSETELEEERRLCYVGITRARENLYMTSTFSRTLFGNTTYNRVSRFIKEIPGNLFESGTDKEKAVEKTSGKTEAKKTDAVNKGFNPSVSFNTVSFKGPQKTAAPNAELKVGDQVRHKLFGEGIITQREKDGDDFKLEIHFKGKGMKRLMESYANLTKLN
ncbi:DNA helicase PcrA [Acetivibrio mesophilus]|uniref:ATP-dependent DNA helicase n=1 Tax=Acetivibrio mesophilus TaxID=2487273 RepID=A0A4Q0I1V0_9FIRM|nr:DNA helicase PcrA [Acetivibrio mesophilus]RXE58121.1 DNA helicase PcrA [Acetivibrio mesophilus]